MNDAEQTQHAGRLSAEAPAQVPSTIQGLLQNERELIVLRAAILALQQQSPEQGPDWNRACQHVAEKLQEMGHD